MHVIYVENCSLLNFSVSSGETTQAVKTSRSPSTPGKIDLSTSGRHGKITARFV